MNFGTSITTIWLVGASQNASLHDNLKGVVGQRLHDLLHDPVDVRLQSAVDDRLRGAVDCLVHVTLRGDLLLDTLVCLGLLDLPNLRHVDDLHDGSTFGTLMALWAALSTLSGCTVSSWPSAMLPTSGTCALAICC